MAAHPHGLKSLSEGGDRIRLPDFPRDPAAMAVQVALAVYLTPVVLVVCLIGGVSLVASGLGRLAHQVLSPHRLTRQPVILRSATANEAARNLRANRQRSHAAH